MLTSPTSAVTMDTPNFLPEGSWGSHKRSWLRDDKSIWNKKLKICEPHPDYFTYTAVCKSCLPKETVSLNSGPSTTKHWIAASCTSAVLRPQTECKTHSIVQPHSMAEKSSAPATSVSLSSYKDMFSLFKVCLRAVVWLKHVSALEACYYHTGNCIGNSISLLCIVSIYINHCRAFAERWE